LVDLLRQVGPGHGGLRVYCLYIFSDRLCTELRDREQRRVLGACGSIRSRRWRCTAMAADDDPAGPRMPGPEHLRDIYGTGFTGMARQCRDSL